MAEAALNELRKAGLGLALLAGLGACGRSEVFDCKLSVDATSIDFGAVAAGDSATRAVTLSNLGNDGCQLTGLGLASGSDPAFALAGAGTTLSLPSGGTASVSVVFSPTPATPSKPSGTLSFQTSDLTLPSEAIPLTATVARCELSVSPTPLDFGNILLNSSATDQVTLSNTGDLPCQISAIALAAGSDPDFSLPTTQPTSLTVAAGGSASISVTFTDLSGDQQPFLRQGTLGFQTGDPSNPTADVPVEAYVNTVCEEAGQWIFTVDGNGTFSRFDPTTLAFTDIGVLACPTSSSPISMAVDQNAIAWVLYESGNLFRVDTGTAACEATSFVPNQEGQLIFGMSFVFQPSTGLDTLFVSGAGAVWKTGQDLATIAFPSLTLTTIARIPLGDAELAGTGDGQLWGFFPGFGSSTGISTLAQLDPQTAVALKTYEYPSLTTNGDFATKFWGGSFWIFLGSSVYQVPRETGIMTTAIADTGRGIVGAGVSSCAPVQ